MDLSLPLLRRDAFGQLILEDGEGVLHAVTPVRSFPISAPDEGIALVDARGAERAWLPSLQALAPETRELVREALAQREFMPCIQRVVTVSSYATPSRWMVQTDRGDTELTLKGEEDIRRISPTTLLITDKQGIVYLVRDLRELDKTSRRLLSRFL